MKLKQAALNYGGAGWKIFPILPGAKNPPLCKWGTQATDQANQINAWWGRTERANIGLACGQSKLAVLDIDTKDGRRGRQTLERLELELGLKLSPTRMQRTPSGGLQYFYRGEIPTSQNVIGKTLWDDGISHIDTRGVGGSGGGYVLLPPSETVFNADKHTKAGVYEWINGANFPIAPLDDWVLRLFDESLLIGHNQEPQQFVVDPDDDGNIAWFEHYLAHDAPVAVQGEGGELTTLAKIGGVAKDRGLSEDVALDLIYHSLWNEMCDPPWGFDELKTKIHNAYSYLKQNAPGSETPKAHFQDDPQPDATPQKVKQDRERRDASFPDDAPAPASTPKIGTPANRTDDFANDPIDGPINNDDLLSEKPTKPSRYKEAVARVKARGDAQLERGWTFAELCDEWVYITQMDRFICETEPSLILKKAQFDDRFAYAKPDVKGCKTVSSVMFNRLKNTIRKPMRAAFLPGENPGMLHGGLDYNLYKASEVVAAQGDTTFWDEHLAYLWPNQVDRDHVLNWCGWLLQNIALKPKHALLLAGYVQGTGKSFITEVLTRIVGVHNVSPIGSIELASSFNKWALGSKLLTIEELDALEKNVIKHTLHPIITQETLTINDKGISTFPAANCFGILANTNEDAALRLTSNDRRYLVVRTHAKPMSQHYYSDLYSLLDDTEAMGAIAYQLMTRDLGEYNAQARAPETEAKAEMVLAGMNDLEVWMNENAGIWPLSGRIISVDDIIAILPARLERLQRLSSNIRSILKHKFQGINLGQCRLPDGSRASLWAMNGSAITKIEGANFGAIYAKDKSERGTRPDKQGDEARKEFE